MALLFFMDHLMQKNGRRTIHDLSCQFGARGFSQEMREAVGATQEGLTDFLSQFPSLFALEGDTVTMTGYGDLAAGGAKASPLLQALTRDRDYEMEAVEFFEEKLRRFGPELQIKSLLGHRSQSAPEIRLVSGRHVKEFADFLASHPDHFLIDQDRVRLRHMPEPADKNHLADIDEDGRILTGAKAKQRALDFLRETVEEACGYSKENNAQTTPLPIDTLYQKFCCRFAHRIRQEVATNPKELLQFLKLNRHIFFIRSNKVSIVRNRPGNSGDTGGTNSLNGDNESPRTDDGSSDSSGIRSSPSLIASGATLTRPSSFLSNGGGNGLISSNHDNVVAPTRSPPTPVVVKSLAGAQTALAELALCGDAVGVDAKLVSVGERRFLSLVALASADGMLLYVFDVAHSASILLESGLKEMLEADDFVKVMHDCANLANLLRQQYQISMRNIFDTQLANIVLQHQRTGKVFRDIRPINFITVQRLYHPQSLMFTDTNIAHQRSVKNWSVRPLTDEMTHQSVEEVRFLMPFIYRSMNSSIRPDLRAMFNQMCDEAVLPHLNVNMENLTLQNDSHPMFINSNMASINNNRSYQMMNGKATNSAAFVNNGQMGNNSTTAAAPFLPCCACKCHKSFAPIVNQNSGKVIQRDAAVQTEKSASENFPSNDKKRNEKIEK